MDYKNRKYRIKEILDTEISVNDQKILIQKWMYADEPSLGISVSTFYNYLRIEKGDTWTIPEPVLETICKDLSEVTGKDINLDNINTELEPLTAS